MSESNISTTRRIEYIDAIKGFSILWVVIYHFNDFLPGVLPQWAQSPFRMPLFFFMSGIFFRERKSFGEFVVKKINTLIVPFIFFYCAGKTYQACFSLASATAGKGEFHFDLHGLFDLFSLIPADSPVQNPLGVGAIWFLIGLFNIQLLYYGLRRISRKVIFLVAVSLLLFFVSLWLNTLFAWGSLWYWIYSMRFMIFYVAGNLCGNALVQLLDNLRYEAVLGGAALTLFIVCSLLGDPHNLYLKDMILLIETTGFIVLTFLFFRNTYRSFLCRPLSFFGRNSIVLLGTHIIIIEFFVAATKNTVGNQYLTSPAFPFFLFAVICMISYLSIRLFTKYIPFLIGKQALISLGHESKTINNYKSDDYTGGG